MRTMLLAVLTVIVLLMIEIPTAQIDEWYPSNKE